MISVLNTRPKVPAATPSGTHSMKFPAATPSGTHNMEFPAATPSGASPAGVPAESTLNAALRAAGFNPIVVPLVELVLLQNALSLLEKVSESHYDGILLTSPNLLPLLRAAGREVPAAWRTKPWYLVGERARADVEALGARVVFVPRGEASLEGFLDEIPRQSNLRLIHPCSTKTRLEPSLFTGKGIDMHNMALYEPRCPAGAAEALEAAWPALQPDIEQPGVETRTPDNTIPVSGAVLLASGSAVHHLFAVAPRLARTLSHDDGPVPVSIGASTSRALRMYGIERFHQAPTADNAGFIAALQAIYKRTSP